MRRNHPTLDHFFLIVFVTGILVCDGLVAYWRILFPRTLIVYLLWIIPFGFLARWARKKLRKRNADK